jgi:hypothetical protein
VCLGNLDHQFQVNLSRSHKNEESLRKLRLIDQKHKQHEFIAFQIAEREKIKNVEKWSKIKTDKEILIKDIKEVKLFENDKSQKKRQKHKLYEVLKLNYDKFKQAQKSDQVKKIEDGKRYLQEYEKLMNERDQIKQKEVHKYKDIHDNKVILNLKNNDPVNI